MIPHDAALEAAVVACEMQSDDTLVNRHMMPRFVGAYLAALSAAGYAVVPREATAEMMRAFWLAGPYPEKPFQDGYAAMVATAPGSPHPR